MRLVKVKAPEGKGAEVAQVAFGVGISEVSVRQEQVFKANLSREVKDAVDVETSTSAAKAFIDALMSAPFFDPEEYSIAVRQPRAIVSREKLSELTWPIVLPTIDVCEDLWQFSHVTFSFVGRMLIGALLLSFGMIKFNLLFIIAGLLFMPFLPLLLAVGFGVLTREWRLAGHGAIAFIVGTTLTVIGGMIVALMMEPPLRYQEFNPLPVSVLHSLIVGVAAGLATSDDVGRRELIGLAATAQIALLPAWFGISFIFGFPELSPVSPAERALTFFLNVCTVIIAAIGTYALLRVRGESLRRFAQSDAHAIGSK